MKLHLESIKVAPDVWQAAAIIILFFVLILVIAYIVRNFLSWSIPVFAGGLFVGLIMILITDGFLLVNGKTITTKNSIIKNMLQYEHTQFLEELNVPKACWPKIK
ncbi:MAG TPA: hypothetical protein VG895_03465 [Patescibacteria group bacterium]|nr:hypothetical protein [Patescibacteria group bacterium]